MQPVSTPNQLFKKKNHFCSDLRGGVADEVGGACGRGRGALQRDGARARDRLNAMRHAAREERCHMR